MTARFGGVLLTRHDAVLVWIATTLLVGVIVGLVSGVSLRWTLGVACVLAVPSVLYALVYKPPKTYS